MPMASKTKELLLTEYSYLKCAKPINYKYIKYLITTADVHHLKFKTLSILCYSKNKKKYI